MCLDNASISEEQGDASCSHRNAFFGDLKAGPFMRLLGEFEEAAISSRSLLTYPGVI